MKTRKIILCRGIQGSGKSTWAKQWVLEDPEHRIRINRDDIRNMLGKYWAPSREKLITDAERHFVLNAMDKGYDIVIDDMNLNPKTVQEIKSWVISIQKDIPWIYEYEIEFKDFWTPVEECIRRDAMRPNPIGEAVIRKTWKTYRNFIISESIKEMCIKQSKQQKNTPIDAQWCIIVDMDATLCFNTSGRPFYGPGASEKMELDVPNVATVDLVKKYGKDKDVQVIIVTGRHNSSRRETENWLNSHGVPYDKLFMRDDNDYSKGEEFKKNVYEHFIKDKFNILFVLEDSQRCVDMYRNLGLTVLQPNEGKF